MGQPQLDALLTGVQPSKSQRRWSRPGRGPLQLLFRGGAAEGDRPDALRLEQIVGDAQVDLRVRTAGARADRELHALGRGEERQANARRHPCQVEQAGRAVVRTLVPARAAGTATGSHVA